MTQELPVGHLVSYPDLVCTMTNSPLAPIAASAPSDISAAAPRGSTPRGGLGSSLPGVRRLPRGERRSEFLAMLAMTSPVGRGGGEEALVGVEVELQLLCTAHRIEPHLNYLTVNISD